VSPRYDTPGWPETGSLLLRCDNQADRELLIAHVRDEDIYRVVTEGELAVPDSTIFRFTSFGEEFEVVDVAGWKSATGPTIWSTAPFLEPFELSNDLLLYRGQRVKTHGQTVMAVIASPDRKLIAVLSATGRRFGDLMPFLSRPRPTGARYHQVYRRSDGSEVGSPILLPFERENDTFHPYWSADASYVVYPHTRFKYVSVIPIHAQESEKDSK